MTDLVTTGEIVADESVDQLDRLLAYSNSPLDFVMGGFPVGQEGHRAGALERS
jgi:hypothetical protein